jgi:hypothetical protein
VTVYEEVANSLSLSAMCKGFSSDLILFHSVMLEFRE